MCHLCFTQALISSAPVSCFRDLLMSCMAVMDSSFSSSKSEQTHKRKRPGLQQSPADPAVAPMPVWVQECTRVSLVG